MPFTGLPGEEQISATSHLKRFRDAYGETADPKDLYRLQQVWIRFAPIWPRLTFLIDSLVDILWHFDGSLYRFANPSLKLNDGDQARMLPGRPTDPFDYFESGATSGHQKHWLINVRVDLRAAKNDIDVFYFKQHARALLDQARDRDRALITEELLSRETAELVSEVPVDVYSGFWAVRRSIAERERMMSEALKELRDDLGQTHALPHSRTSMTAQGDISNTDFEYGAEPLTSRNGARSETWDKNQPTKSRVTFSPPRSPSPPVGRRGRHEIPPDHHDHHWEGRRSMSRDSMFSHGASSIVTWAPTEPDAFSISMKVFSSSLNDWVESIAIMDTGCEGGNFISSSFLEEQLEMGAEIESDPEGESMQFVDFAGKTDFKPMGKVKLRWYGREIKSGRRGTRTLESEDWFRVAPHLTTEDGEKPFQILLGKDWLHDNEVLTYRGLRLFKSKGKKGLKLDPSHQAEQQRRQRLREEAELERLSERLASDAASISTGNSGGYSPSSTPRPAVHFPRASTQSILSSMTGSSPQTNGVSPTVDAHAVLTGGI